MIGAIEKQKFAYIMACDDQLENMNSITDLKVADLKVSLLLLPFYHKQRLQNKDCLYKKLLLSKITSLIKITAPFMLHIWVQIVMYKLTNMDYILYIKVKSANGLPKVKYLKPLPI